MTKDLLKLYEGFLEDNFPHIECLHCKENFYVIKDRALRFISSVESYEAREDEDWDPTWEHGSFTGFLQCRSRECSSHLAISGTYEWIENNSGLKDAAPFERVLKTKYLHPSYPIANFNIPRSTPKKVVEKLNDVDKVIWTDPSSAANRLRIAIDQVLTIYGMRRFKVENRKRKPMSTHQRLNEFKKYETLPAEAFMAVKWIGNQGSHESELKFRDLLEGISIMRYGLEALYGDYTPEIEKKIALINKRKRI